MEQAVKKHLSYLEFKDTQTYRNMTVLPLISSLDGGPSYITLGEAMEKGALTVKEVDIGGSVPELSVINDGEVPVLMLDGEELMGAKQNRVVNTTILLREHSKTIIPVSCTEHGRWQYSSAEFADSDVILATSIRSKKNRSVNESLNYNRSYASDQGEVWAEIRELHVSAGVDSPTGAMKDTFEQKKPLLDDYINAFILTPRQKGLLVFIDSHIVGFDYLSSEDAYTQVHHKLLKSYAIDALVRRHKVDKMPDLNEAKEFMYTVTESSESVYKSVGYGFDHRYENRTAVGSALVHDDTAVHMAFFRLIESGSGEHISSAHRRRGFRGPIE